jgi:hypothetical protein
MKLELRKSITCSKDEVFIVIIPVLGLLYEDFGLRKEIGLGLMFLCFSLTLVLSFKEFNFLFKLKGKRQSVRPL